MTRKIITFLGTIQKHTVYEYDGKPYPGKVFAEALRQFVQFDKMYVFVTKEAREKSYPELEKLNDRRIKPVDIDPGKNVDEMWGWFDKILECVNDGDTVIFDITHGLRSIPFLVFIFAAFLKAARNVTIEAIYYGASELGDAKTGKPAPVIELSEFVSMFDWLSAVNEFLYTGNARQLAALLRQKGKLQKAANTLQTISQAALLCQPFTLMQTVPHLLPDLQAAEDEMVARARPFRILNERINQEFGQFQADFPGDPKNFLQSEYRLIEWYYENKQLIQAMSLAREFLIDAVQYRLSGELQPTSFARGVREGHEWAVSGLPKVGGPHPKEPRDFLVDDLNPLGQTIYQTWPERDLLKKTWGALEVVRNGLDHAEHQKAPLPLESIQKKAERDVMPGLRALAQTWNLA